MSTSASAPIRTGTAAGRWVLAATVLGSGIAFLDSTIVNVALPAIRDDLGGGLAGLQWVIDSYLLTLGALLLLGGSLGDLLGRRRMFVLGLGGFAVTSALCGLAPSIGWLIAGRTLQGISAALLVPGSLSLIQSVFAPEDRARAIGAWSGLSGVTTAIGPFVGGYLIDAVSWRWVFLINLPLAVVAIYIALRHIPETRSPAATRIDAPGAITATLGLGGILFALIEGPVLGWSDAAVIFAATGGAFFLGLFLYIQKRSPSAMLPLHLFASKQFAGANAMTLAVYGALSGSLFLVVLQLQNHMGYSALEAGAAFIPITILLLVLSSSAGGLAQRIGPRMPMTAGPLVMAGGLALLAQVGPGTSYITLILPAMVVFGLGLSLVVAPLTAAVLAAVDDDYTGVASGINNAAARIAGLLAIALLPLAAGMSGTAEDTQAFTAAFQRAMWVSAAMCVVGAAISFATIRKLAPAGSTDMQ